MGFAGGFTLGMVQAGFKLAAKREMKGGFGVPNCEANRHLLGDAWKTEACDPAEWSAVDAEVVFGNPPCSGFSVMSSKEFRGADSVINHCMWAFADYVSLVNPQVAVFESVQQACSEKNGGLDLMRALRAHVEAKTGHSWGLWHVKHNAYSVGGAAQRRRYFWLISRVPFGIELERPRRLPTLNDVIGDLENLSLTWEQQPYRMPASWWARQRRSHAVDGHMNYDSPLARRIYDLIRTVEWNPREGIATVVKRCYERHGHLPDSWRATEQKIVKNNFFMGFTTPVRWDGTHAARVVTGAALHNVIHPNLDRMITHREAARILGFPDDWRVLPLKTRSGLSMTWGKGITVDCGRWIGTWIERSLSGSPGSHTGQPVGDREWMIDITNTYRQSGVKSA